MNRFKFLLGLSLLFFCSLISVQAQTCNDLLSVDKDVCIGKLDNGLTYYIRHNSYPKERAYFYIAQKVGAIQEEPDQRGLAHFLEHMCFNGTKHFPGNELIHYLERIGVKFGADLNAYTAVDQTVYNIDNVPTTVPNAIDSCLYILHDWSNDLTLDSVEINKERGVIHEEWRMRNNADQRINEAMLPVIYPNSKYADSMPIGSMDVVMNFKPQTLRDYYEEWYRPDLQGIVIVGDVDVKKIEAKIKRIFSDIPPASADAAKRIYYPVPNNKAPIVFIGTDKEYSSPYATFYFKHDAPSKEDKDKVGFLIDTYLDNIVYTLFHDRTSEIAQTPDSPFSFAFVRNSNYYMAKTKKAFSANVACKSANGDIERGVKALLRELFRVYRYGFTDSEYERARKNFLIGIDKMIKEKDKRESSSFVDQYVEHFLNNIPIPSLEDECAVYTKMIPEISVEEVNKHFNSLLCDSNMVLVLKAPQNDTLRIPKKEELLKMYKEVKQEKLTPFVDKVSSKPFLPKEPDSGKILTEKTDKDGLIRIGLSNGAKVVIKKTDFKKDEILMQAVSYGGSSLFPAKMYKYSSLMNMATIIGGLGNYSFAEKEKAFAGINADASASVTDNFQLVEGSCSPRDIKYMLEMAYAAFLYPHKDVSAFKSLVGRIKSGIAVSKGKPRSVYSDSLRVTLYGNNEYSEDLTEEDLDKVDYDQLLEMYKERFRDASNFTFFFVGNIEIDSLRPYLEKYIASLPSTYHREKAVPIKTLLKGNRICEFKKEQKTPKSTISMIYSGDCRFNLKNQLVGSMLGQILTMVYTKTIREDAGAAYSVRAGGIVDYYPEEKAKVEVQLSTSPEQKDLAIKLVDKGINDLTENGPSQEELNKVKEYMLKTFESNQTINKYWLYDMTYKWNHGIEYTKDYVKTVKGITVKDIQNMMRMIVKQKNRILVSMS